MSKSKYDRLFATAPLPAPSISTVPYNDAWKPYLDNLDENIESVVAMGESAIPMLLYALSDYEEGGEAAGILGYLRIPDDRVLDALREQVRTGQDHYYWSACSLAILGDVDFLLELANDRTTAEIARTGIEGLYSHYVGHCDPYLPLDLEPLEKFMANGSKPTIKDLWAGCREIRCSDIDEAMKGLESKYGVVRELASTMLSKPNFGKSRPGAKAKQRVLAALAGQLQDKHVGTRRRALCALRDWGPDAKGQTKAVRKALNDPNDLVAMAAEFCLRDIGHG